MLTQPDSILKRILTVSVIAVSTSGIVAMPTAIASDIKQACESLNGTYHSDTENWMCLYNTPNTINRLVFTAIKISSAIASLTAAAQMTA